MKTIDFTEKGAPDAREVMELWESRIRLDADICTFCGGTEKATGRIVTRQPWGKRSVLGHLITRCADHQAQWEAARGQSQG